MRVENDRWKRYLVILSHWGKKKLIGERQYVSRNLDISADVFPILAIIFLPLIFLDEMRQVTDFLGVIWEIRIYVSKVPW